MREARSADREQQMNNGERVGTTRTCAAEPRDRDPSSGRWRSDITALILAVLAFFWLSPALAQVPGVPSGGSPATAAVRTLSEAVMTDQQVYPFGTPVVFSGFNFVPNLGV